MKCRYLINLFGLLSAFRPFPSIIAEQRLMTSVFYFYDLIDIYRQVQNEEPLSQSELNLDVSSKKQICKDIITSHYFHNKHQVDIVNLEDSFRGYSIQPHYFDRIYEKSSVQDSDPVWFNFVYTNSYHGLDQDELLIGPRGDITSFLKEYVFVCLGVHYRTRKMVQYYITREYNMNFNGEYSIPGRFVFERNKNNDKAYWIAALAEESAKAYLSPEHNIELYYLQTKSILKPSERENEDAICNTVTHEDDWLINVPVCVHQYSARSISVA